MPIFEQQRLYVLIGHVLIKMSVMLCLYWKNRRKYFNFSRIKNPSQNLGERGGEGGGEFFKSTDKLDVSDYF